MLWIRVQDASHSGIKICEFLSNYKPKKHYPLFLPYYRHFNSLIFLICLDLGSDPKRMKIKVKDPDPDPDQNK